MAKELLQGSKFRSVFGAEIEIDKLLGSGGQGYVYRVLYNGKPKALKIYKPDTLRNPKGFYENLMNNVKNKAPNSSFLWPTDILPWNGHTCGYIMDLRPSEYAELCDFMNSKKPEVHFASIKAAATAAFEMATAFRILHSKGYSYQDLSDGNFFINPNTGKVLICDNDNVSEYGQNSGILGTPQYMAPEVVRGESLPSTATDRFSLAVIIFILITMTHPLEGRRYLCELLDPKTERILYGTEPIFILDPNDRRNGPVQGYHNNIGLIWPELPDYMRDMFQKQFSKDMLLLHPERRATESEWQQILARFLSDIIRCPYCGLETLSYNSTGSQCGACGKRFPVTKYLKPSGVDYRIPVLSGNVVFRQQIVTSNIDVSGDITLRVFTNPKDPSMTVVQNVSGEELIGVKTNNTRVPMGPGKSMLIERGAEILAYGGKVEME